VTTAISYREKGKYWPEPRVSDETVYHYDYHTLDNNTRTTRYKTSLSRRLTEIDSDRETVTDDN